MQAPPPCFAEFSKKSASPLVEEEVDEGRQEQAQQDRDRVRNGTGAPPKVEGLSIFFNDDFFRENEQSRQNRVHAQGRVATTFSKSLSGFLNRKGEF